MKRLCSGSAEGDLVGGASGVNPGDSQFNGFSGNIVCNPSDFEEGGSAFNPDVLAISGFGFHRTQGFYCLMNEDSELVLVKIVEEMHYCIFVRHDCSLVNVYDRIIGGVNDPYGVKVI